MIRRAFLRRMALAAAACAFIDVPWPKWRPTEAVAVATHLSREQLVRHMRLRGVRVVLNDGTSVLVDSVVPK